MVRLGSPADFPHSLRNKIRRRKKQNDFPKYHPYRAMHDKLTLSSGPPNRERGSSGVDWYWLGFQRRGSPEHPPSPVYAISMHCSGNEALSPEIIPAQTRSHFKLHLARKRRNL